MGPRDWEGANSTKQLISRYETLNYPPFVSKPTKSPSFFKRLSSFSTKKEKSAVRQSFRNLVGLLKKSNDEFKAKRLMKATTTSQDSNAPAEAPLYIPLAMDHADSGSSTTSTRSGPLLYLSRYSWTNCSVDLVNADPRLLLSWTTSSGATDHHSVSLKCCADVRSLDQKQLDAGEIPPLPRNEDGEEYKAFEILYQDESRETFAALSTRERARWVSTIWDSVLSDQDAKSAFRQILAEHQAQDTTQSRIDVAKPLPEASERVLPAVPLDLEATDSRTTAPDGLPFHNASPDLPVHPEPPALSVHTNTAQLQSPSIANLSTRSVVKQRLAQMERQNSSHSSRSALSPRSRHSEHPVDCFPVQGHDSGRSDLVDSILGGYHVQAEPEHAMTCLGIGTHLSALQDGLTRLADREQLDEKFLSLQLNIQNVPRELAGVMDSRTEHVATSVDQISRILSSFDNRSSNTHAVLQSIENTMQEVKTNLKERVLLDQRSVPRDGDSVKVMPALETLQNSVLSELAAVLRKLDDITKISGVLSEKAEKPQPSPPFAPTEIAEILKLLKEEEANRSAQAQQQSDSVRYLNELNVWLEAFVNNGTSHIQGMSSALKQLCDALGFDAASSKDQGRSLISDVQKLVQETRLREQHAATLQETVNSIAIHLNSSVGHILSPQAMADLMHKQRREHEGLLKALTAVHVEEFKKELKREVQGMTQEVSRLHQEKQNMENQIAELFAFHTRQKTGPVRASVQHNIPPDYGGAHGIVSALLQVTVVSMETTDQGL
ncbi:hypothetical protein AAF712_004079 [Marasmius tenuissimus]|uniref:PH domain-containing protein n=1 Tax=Marasmius tenuissimus TaxID=585030 RepID=A0ABR3A5G5_9AGAR